MGDILTNKAWEEALERADMVLRILQDWADWNHWHKTMHLDMPSRSAVFLSGGAVSEEGEEGYLPADIDRLEIIDVCIDSLPPDQRSAIHHRYLCSVYRMRDYKDALARAHDALLSIFVRKGVMW